MSWNNEYLARALADKAIETFGKAMQPVAWRVRYINMDGRLTDWFYFDSHDEAVQTALDDGEIEPLYLSPSPPKSK